MKTEYRRDLHNNYLILEIPKIDEEEDYGLRMVQQNQVKGLLPVHVSGMDGKRYLNYEITSRQTLESLYEKKVMGYPDILFIFSGIYDTMEEMRKYLLSWQRLLFAPELIYVLPERRGLLLCYYVKEEECPITALAEFILKRLDHRDRQAVALGYGFYQQISETNFSLAKTLKEILAGAREAAPGKNLHQGAAGQSASYIKGMEPDRVAFPDGRSGVSALREYGRQAAPDSRNRPGVFQEYGRQAAPEDRSRPGGIREYGRQAFPDDRSRPGVFREYGRQEVPDDWSKPEAIPEYDRWEAPDRKDRSRAVHEDGRWGGSDERRIPDAYEESEDGRIGSNDMESREHMLPPRFAQKKNRKKNKDRDLADWLFSRVHPAVMITFLGGMVVLELLIVFGVLGIREAGGCFFLVLSGEVLINRRILHKNNYATEEWEEEEDEEYQKILQEVYQAESEPETAHEHLEETCYLNSSEGSGEGEEKLSLICVSPHPNGRVKPGNPSGQQGSDALMANSHYLSGTDIHGANSPAGRNMEFPDIHPGETPLYIGKIRGEADILLDVSTVSRMHARLEVRENVCYLRDMNSKNGTFVNGRRLQPQEECEIRAEDTVEFAEVEYRAVLTNLAR
ncbi:MAG: FHA domain-containing protein [Lachnospiraceae bacterium]|nr:FHA domain-containing protein [Lachnospiraceae bacterium]